MADWNQYIFRDGYFAIAQGKVGGRSLVHITGYNPDVDSAESESVWSAGGLYPWSVWDTTRTLTVVSTSALDQGSIIVSGLDANFLPITDELDWSRANLQHQPSQYPRSKHQSRTWPT